MNWKSTIAVGALALATSITGPALTSSASAAPTHDATSFAKVAKHKHKAKKHHTKKHQSSTTHHSCTTTSSGSCIRGGEFCPQSKYNQGGYDSKGRHYTCKGDHTHPHWMK